MNFWSSSSTSSNLRRTTFWLFWELLLSNSSFLGCFKSKITYPEWEIYKNFYFIGLFFITISVLKILLILVSLSSNYLCISFTLNSFLSLLSLISILIDKNHCFIFFFFWENHFSWFRFVSILDNRIFTVSVIMNEFITKSTIFTDKFVLISYY